MEHTLAVQVIHELAAAPQKAKVLDALYRGADEIGDECVVWVHALALFSVDR